MTLQLKTPTLPKINKTAVIVAVSVLVFLAIVAVGAVSKVRADRVAAAESAQLQAQAEASIKANAARIQALELEAKQLTAEKQTVALACSELRKYDADRVITARVVVPQYCTGR